jgi:hypothetical protein
VLLLVDSSPSAKAFFPLQHPVRTVALAPLNQKAGPNSHMRAFATNLPLLRLYIDAIDIVSTRIGVLVPTNLNWFSVDEGCLSTRATLACLRPSFWFPASEARRSEKHKNDGLVIQPVFQKRAAMEKKRRDVSGLAMLSNMYMVVAVGRRPRRRYQDYRMIRRTYICTVRVSPAKSHRLSVYRF